MQLFADDIKQRAANLGIDYQKLQSFGENRYFLTTVDVNIENYNYRLLSSNLVGAISTNNANEEQKNNLNEAIYSNIGKFLAFCEQQDRQTKYKLHQVCKNNNINDPAVIQDYISRNFKSHFSLKNFKEHVIDEMQSEAFINSLTNASKKSRKDLKKEPINDLKEHQDNNTRVHFGIKEDKKDIGLLYKILVAVVKVITFGKIDITPKTSFIDIKKKEYNPHQPSNVVGKTEEITTTMQTPERTGKYTDPPKKTFPDPDKPEKTQSTSSTKNTGPQLKSILKNSKVVKHTGFVEKIENESGKNTGMNR